MRKSKGGQVGAFLASCLVLSALACPWPALAASLANISMVQNAVNYRVADRDEWGPAAVGMPLYNGDWTKTGSLSRVEITYKDGTLVRLASTCILQHVDPGSRLLRLILGKIWAKVHKGGLGMKIITPAAVAATTGTEFIIEVMPDQSMHLTVLEGTVLLFPPNLSPATVQQGVEKAKQQGSPPQTQSGEPAKRQELNETMTVGGQSAHKSEPPPQPVAVSAGQGAIARPDVPLNAAFAVDMGVVRTQESSVLPTSSVIVGPAAPVVNLTPVAAPRTQAITTTTNQLRNQSNDLKTLQGSPTTGGIRAHIK